MRISASNAARDRNSPIKAHQINLQRSLIDRTIDRFAGVSQLFWVYGRGTGGAGPLSPERERALKSKDTFKECVTCPEMVVVPAGDFAMGSPDSEQNHDASQSPQHRVTFARQFAVGRRR
jgi:formylglycine-generating enzyme required for sulfatase activity